MVKEGTEHNCVEEVDESESGGIAEEPLGGEDVWKLFVDGPWKYHEGVPCTAWAVMNKTGTVLRGSQIPGTWAAQVAELIALTEALRLAAGKRVNIYTDSWYAFGVVHDYMVDWARRGYITSSGGHVQHEQHIRDLVEAARTPAEAAVSKVAAHKKIQTPQQQGNDYADRAAKALTEQIPEGPGKVVSAIAALVSDPDSMGKLQAITREKEKEEWKQEGAIPDPDEIWRK
ncbi:hypothetical protein scyTo_0016042 [Scyliorhinus torazame]|uniref:RNase H type-1 domain-containing protein n=1 Tax=Scyliorhinus torazame TaxID=75743 RepID=A0A401Q393_SCYTO|nr:hypothetical protein [Scyliorhinus torazame]